MYGDNVSIKSIEEAMAQYNIGNKSVAQEQDVVQNKPEYEDNYKNCLKFRFCSHHRQACIFTITELIFCQFQ